MDDKKLRIAKLINSLELRSSVGEYPERDFQMDVKTVEDFISSIEAEARADERKKMVGKIQSLQENGYIEMPWEMLIKELDLEEHQ